MQIKIVRKIVLKKILLPSLLLSIATVTRCADEKDDTRIKIQKAGDALIQVGWKGRALTVENLNETGLRGITFLIWVIQNGYTANGYTQSVQALIDAKANPNIGGGAVTALMCAAANGRTEIVQVLIDAKAHINTAGCDGRDSLFYAAMHGHTATVQVLMNAKACIDNRNRFGDTALGIAAHNGRTATVVTLIANGAAINTANHNGTTILHDAACSGNSTTVKALIDAKAHVDKKDGNGCTALMITAKNDHTEALQVLLEARAQVDIVNWHGNTALMLTLQKNCCGAAQILIDAKADIGISNEYGKTVLMQVAQLDHIPASQILINVLINGYYGQLIKKCPAITSKLIHPKKPEVLNKREISIVRILPDELIEFIFELLDKSAIANTRLTSTHFLLRSQHKFNKIRQERAIALKSKTVEDIGSEIEKLRRYNKPEIITLLENKLIEIVALDVLAV